MQLKQNLSKFTLIFSLISIASADWDVFVRHECGGGYELIPNLPGGMKMNFPAIEKIFTTFGDVLFNRAKCQCPGLSPTDFALHYDPFTALLNALEEGNTTVVPSSPCSFPTSLTQLSDLFNVKFTDPNFKRSCNINRWITDGKCDFAFPAQEIGVNINFNFWKCPKSKVGIPGFELSCSGPGCKTFAVPCSRNDQCNGGQSCMMLIPDESTQSSILQYYVMPIFGPQASTCYNQPGNNLISAAMTHLRSYFDTQRVNVMGFCGVGELFSGRVSSASMEAISLEMSKEVSKTCFNYGSQVAELTLRNLIGSTVLPKHDNRTDAPFRENLPTWLEWTCDSKLVINDDMLGFKLSPQTNRLLNTLVTYLYNIANCALKTKLTPQQFLVRFGLWSPAFWLNLFDIDAATSRFDVGPEGFDFRSWFGGGYVKVSMPKTCSFATWLRTGRCDLQFASLAELLGLDTSLVVSVSYCPNDYKNSNVSPIPCVKIQCAGSDCGMIVGESNFCQSNDDCQSNNAMCVNLEMLLYQLTGGIGGPYDYDPIGTWILPAADEKTPNICSVFGSFNGKDIKCGGGTKFSSDFHLILEAFGVKPPLSGYKNDASTSVCIPNLEYIARNAERWGMMQILYKYLVLIDIPGLRQWVPNAIREFKYFGQGRKI
ncbi:hypothetical protein HK098_005289 [Nowakowskiella sp. JEL0407]|nr:hypothetical protein HK098_005289 [Nowakowskiella sp. JEL0407]